jgi:4-hydroxy-tetrahydrodipicolinate synthase
MVTAFLAGHLEDARRFHYMLYPVFTALFYETNPIPVKEALSLMGKIDGELRLPLCGMGLENKEKLAAVMKDCGLI